jgi:hypothetical protein
VQSSIVELSLTDLVVRQMADLSPEIITAIVTAGASLIGVGILFVRGHLSENKKMAFHSKHEETSRYHAQLSRINKYREPLIQACLDLYHYLEAVFYRDRNGLETERDKVEMLYAFAQLFGWMEIVRKELLEFNFDDAELNMNIRTALGNVYTAFEDANYVSDNSFHQTYMEQRALGELMLSEKNTCSDYTTFVTHLSDPGFKNWFRGLKNSLTALELSLSQFDPATYYKIQHGELHAWSEDGTTPGLCDICGGNKSSAHHRGDITAHFNRLYRIYCAIIELAKILDFEKKRVRLKVLSKPPSGWKARLSAWWKPDNKEKDALSSIIVDRIRHSFVDRIVKTYRHASNASNSRSPSSAVRQSTEIPSVVEQIDIMLKLRKREKIIDEIEMHINTDMTVSELREKIAIDMSQRLAELGWDVYQLTLSSLVSNLDIDMKLSQYGMRNGSIIYVGCAPVASALDSPRDDNERRSSDNFKIDISSSDNYMGAVVGETVHHLLQNHDDFKVHH